MFRKLLQIAGIAALLTAAGFFFFEGLPTSARTASRSLRRAEASASAPSATAPEGAEAKRATAEIAEPARATPSQLLEQALSQLPNLPPMRRGSFIKELITQLRAAGIPGLHAVADFLRSGRDFHVGTLRIALIGALGNWEGALPLNLEILKSDVSVWETLVVIRNLELEFPGAYRVQAVDALRRRLVDLETINFGAGGADSLFATIGHLQATELLPTLEDFVNRSRSMADEYVEMLNTFPAGVRAPAVSRLFESPEMRSHLASQPEQVSMLSFRDENVRSAMVDLFANEMNARQRLAMLETFKPASMGAPLLFATPAKMREAEQARSKVAVEEAQSRKAFLQTARDAIAILPKEPSTPAVESAINEAQKRITDDLAKRVVEVRLESKPAVEVDFADGTGKAQIKGRRIEAIELLAPAVVQPAPSEDSTDSPDR